VPYVIKVIQRATDHGISYGIMTTLHFSDLQALIIEYDIRDLEQEIERKEKERLDQLGISRRKATPEEINRLHGLS
jgi:hypothetical protein